MNEYSKSGSAREEIKRKLREHFDGRIVRKDLTKKIKEGANVNVESAMAARNEEVKKSIAELNQIKVQPVYEIKL